MDMNVQVCSAMCAYEEIRTEHLFAFSLIVMSPDLSGNRELVLVRTLAASELLGSGVCLSFSVLGLQASAAMPGFYMGAGI